MARFFPPTLRPTSPTSEAKTWKALQALDDDWCVFHSVVWQGARGGRQADGEADFILLHRSLGMVVVEVKGGRISLDEGRWFTTDRDDVRHEIKNPFEQAKDSKYALLEYLRGLELDLPTLPFVCHVVVFPDLTLLEGIGLQPRDLVWDGADLRNLPRALERLLRHWSHRPGPEISPLQLSSIIQRLAPTLLVRRRLRTDVAESEAELVRLTDRQVEVLRNLRRVRRCIVEGSAGTGKTVVALAKARQFAEDGAKVLFVCFNAPLAGKVAREVADQRAISATSFHSLCARAARDTGHPIPPSPDDEWWEQKAAELLALWSAHGRAPRFEALVVDEAQDFAPGWLECLEQLLVSPENSPTYLFADPHQQIYRRPGLVLPAWPSFTLDRNCRNTLPIARAVASVFGDESPEEGANGKAPVLIETTDSNVVAVTQRVADRLLGEEGLASHQLTVLADSRETVERLRRTGTSEYPFVSPGQAGVVTETLHRFKGLESEVVVLALSERFAREIERNSAELYVGLSRARSLLVVLGPGSLRKWVEFT